MPNFVFFAPFRIYCVASKFGALLTTTRRVLYYVIRGLSSFWISAMNPDLRAELFELFRSIMSSWAEPLKRRYGAPSRSFAGVCRTGGPSNCPRLFRRCEKRWVLLIATPRFSIVWKFWGLDAHS